MNNITIRTVLPSDTDAIYQFIFLLEGQTFDRSIIEKILLHNLSVPEHIYLIAENDEQPIGFISCHAQLLLHHAGYVYEIQELFVAEAYRSQGVGKQLLDELMQRLSSRPYDLLEVASNNKRKAAHAFYQRNGFTQSHQKFTRKGDM